MAGDHAGDFLQKLFQAGGIMEKACYLPHVTNEFGMVAFDEHLNDLKVGEQGFEPWTSCSQSKRASQLRYSPEMPLKVV